MLSSCGDALKLQARLQAARFPCCSFSMLLALIATCLCCCPWCLIHLLYLGTAVLKFCHDCQLYRLHLVLYFFHANTHFPTTSHASPSSASDIYPQMVLAFVTPPKHRLRSTMCNKSRSRYQPMITSALLAGCRWGDGSASLGAAALLAPGPDSAARAAGAALSPHSFFSGSGACPV